MKKFFLNSLLLLSMITGLFGANIPITHAATESVNAHLSSDYVTWHTHGTGLYGIWLKWSDKWLDAQFKKPGTLNGVVVKVERSPKSLNTFETVATLHSNVFHSESTAVVGSYKFRLRAVFSYANGSVTELLSETVDVVVYPIPVVLEIDEYFSRTITQEQSYSETLDFEGGPTQKNWNPYLLFENSQGKKVFFGDGMDMAIYGNYGGSGTSTTQWWEGYHGVNLTIKDSDPRWKDLTPGTYTVYGGLYDPQTNERLSLRILYDHVFQKNESTKTKIGTVTVKPAIRPITILPWTAPAEVVIGKPFTYSLNWSGGPAYKDLKTYIHIAKEDGTSFFAISNSPTTPTSQWNGTARKTTFTTTLPSTIPPGTYPIYAGLFDATDLGLYRITLTPGIGVTAHTEKSGKFHYKVGTLTVLAPGTTSVPPTTATSTPSNPVATPASINVVAPNGGEIYKVGDSVTIRWGSANLASTTKVNLRLTYVGSNGSALEDDIPSGTSVYPLASANSYQWVIPAKYGSGVNQSMFKLRAIAFREGVVETLPQDYSNGFFSILPVATSTPSNPVATSTSQTPVIVVSTSTSSLTVLAPNGGEKVIAGQTMNFRWVAKNLPPEKTIDDMGFSLVTTSGTVTNLNFTKSVSFTSGFNGYFSKIGGTSSIRDFMIPSSISPGQYKLIVTCKTCSTGVSDMSDNYFTILGASLVPTLTVTSPAANQNITVGQLLPISWTTTNTRPERNLSIWLFNQENTTLGYPLISAVKNDAGSYTVTVPPTVVPGKYAVQIYCTDCAQDNGYQLSKSGNVFTISALPGSLNVTSPSGGVYQAGELMMIRWTSQSITGNVSVEILSSDRSRTIFSTSVNGNPGYYAFTIPRTTTVGQYLVRVKAANASDESDTAFTVSAPASVPSSDYGDVSFQKEHTVNIAAIIQALQELIAAFQQ
jgi:hypothetical protein